MPHEISRVLRAVAAAEWFIEPTKAEAILAMLELRSAGEPRAWKDDGPAREEARISQTSRSSAGNIHLLHLHGTIFPRSNMMSDMSGGMSCERFQAAFSEAAADPDAAAIVLDIDSPGGIVDLVPETASMIFGARREGRPIIAVANTLAASAAYWLASAADEIVVTPSGRVGSIGVYMVHDDVSAGLEKAGIKRTFIFEGARKVEGNPATPLDATAKAALQASVRESYAMFTADVAKFRNVSVSTVRADPEESDEHFGGGRVYRAREAVRLGMADSVGTLTETISRVAGRKQVRRTNTARARLRLA